MSAINFPLLYIPDPAKGRPLFNGQLYVGLQDLDPTISTNQKQLNVIQENGTVVPVSQPLTLSAGGVPVYNGIPVRLDVDGNYSMKVLDKLGAQVYYIENAYKGQPITDESLSQSFIFNTVAEFQASTILFPDGKIIHLNDRNADFTKTTGTASANGFTVIASTTINQSISIIVRNGVISAKAIGAISDGVTRTQDALITAIATLPLDTVVLLGGKDDVYLLYTSADGTVSFGANVLDFNRRIHFSGKGAKLKLDASVKAYIAEVNVDDVEIEGICFDGNRANNINNATSNTLLRAVSVDRGKIQFCQFINGASSGTALDGCSRWIKQYNYYDNFYRNAIQVASSALIPCDENEILFNYVNGTDDGEFANGIFLSSSADTSAKNLTSYRNKIIGNVIKNAGDWGIESGYRMFNTLIQANIVDQAFNICIGARDNTGSIIDGNIAISNISGSQQINYQIDGDSISGDVLAPNSETKTILSNNYGQGAGTNAVNIKDARKVQASNNILIGRSASIGIAFNIKGDRANITGNYAESFQTAYRFSRDGGGTLSDVVVRGNSANGVGEAYKFEAITLKDSLISDNSSSQITSLVVDNGVTIDNSRYYGNVTTDEPFKWSATLNNFILSSDGMQRDIPAVQFGESSIATPVRACTLRIKLDNGEVALFLVSSEVSPTITPIAESASIGDSVSVKDFRVEIISGNLVIKRYAVTTARLKWFAEIS